MIAETADVFSIDAMHELPETERLPYVFDHEAELAPLKTYEMDRVTTLLTGIRLVTVGV